MNNFYNGKEINKGNLLSMIKGAVEEDWNNSDLERRSEIVLERIAGTENYEGKDEDISCILEKLESSNTIGYNYRDANLQDVENIISSGEWYFEKLEDGIAEIIEKEILDIDELNKVLDSDQVYEWENCGSSGKYMGCNWYNVTGVNGEEYNIYC